MKENDGDKKEDIIIHRKLSNFSPLWFNREKLNDLKKNRASIVVDDSESSSFANINGPNSFSLAVEV